MCIRRTSSLEKDVKGLNRREKFEAENLLKLCRIILYNIILDIAK